MVWSEGLRAASLFAVLCFVQSGLITWPLLAFLGALAACGTVAYSVATPAFVPSLVPPGALPAANARIELARTLAFTGGPAIGGALIGSVGAGTAFAAAAGLSLVAVMLLAGLHENPRPRHADRRPLRDMTEAGGADTPHAGTPYMELFVVASGVLMQFQLSGAPPATAYTTRYGAQWQHLLATFVPGPPYAGAHACQ